MPQNDDDVQIFMPPNEIAKKVSVGGPGGVTEDQFDRSEMNIKTNFGAQYPEWLADDLRKLEDAFAEMIDGIAADHHAVEACRDCVHEMRGMGGMFGYDLITSIGDQMYRLVSSSDTIGPGRLAALRVHHDALKLVAGEKLQGDGGPLGQKVLAGLQQVYAKYA